MIEYMYTGDYDQTKPKSRGLSFSSPNLALEDSNNDYTAAATVAITTPTAAASTATTSSANTSSTTPSTAAVITTISASSTTPSTAPSSAPNITPSNTPAPSVTNGTLHHVQVNAIADYYGIQGLARLANQKIQRAYLTSWDLNTFVPSVKAAINDSGDKPLHNMMALHTAQKLKELLQSGQLPSLVGDFAASVLAYHAHLLEASQREQSQAAMQQQQQQQAQAQQQQQQAQAASQQRYNDLLVRCQAAEARAARVVENVGKLINLSNSRHFCRNGGCEEDFTSYVEAAGDPAEPSYILRCSSCGCRHYTN